MRDHRGFTLIELVVTLAILAILVALSVPYYNTQLAKNNAYRSQAAGLAQAVSSFYAVTGCYPSSVALDKMPTGMAPYVGGVWPAGYHYLSLDQSLNATASQSSAYYIGVAVDMVGARSELQEVLWVVPGGAAWGTSPPVNTTPYPTC